MTQIKTPGQIDHEGRLRILQAAADYRAAGCTRNHAWKKACADNKVSMNRCFYEVWMERYSGQISMPPELDETGRPRRDAGEPAETPEAPGEEVVSGTRPETATDPEPEPETAPAPATAISDQDKAFLVVCVDSLTRRGVAKAAACALAGEGFACPLSADEVDTWSEHPSVLAAVLAMRDSGADLGIADDMRSLAQERGLLPRDTVAAKTPEPKPEAKAAPAAAKPAKLSRGGVRESSGIPPEMRARLVAETEELRDGAGCSLQDAWSAVMRRHGLALDRTNYYNWRSRRAAPSAAPVPEIVPAPEPASPPASAPEEPRPEPPPAAGEPARPVGAVVMVDGETRIHWCADEAEALERARGSVPFGKCAEVILVREIRRVRLSWELTTKEI